MKFLSMALLSLLTSWTFACPQFSATNALCVDEGESFPVDSISLIGNTFTLVAFGHVNSATLPSVETNGEYTMRVECSGNSVITTETFGPHQAVSVSTVIGNEMISTGETMVLGCPTGDCDNGPLTFEGIAPESFSCSW